MTRLATVLGPLIEALKGGLDLGSLEYDKYTLHTNKQHSEEEPQNTDCHKTQGRQLK